jgi:REP element-mobilizing transposase RayT
MAPRKPQLKLDLRPRRKDGKLAKKRGPKPKTFKTDVPHRTRGDVEPRFPVHVSLRVTNEVARLRTRKAYQAVRAALRLCAARSDFRVVQISIQDNHIHALVEAENKEALARGMQGFEISAAKRLNKALGRKRGKVFAHRYFARTIRTPTEVRNALVYLFNNWKKHRVDGPWCVDPFSSAAQFGGWATAHGFVPRDEPLPVVRAQSWLLREGWTRAKGGLIRLDEVPKEVRS